jgi:hypothetical protein
MRARATESESETMKNVSRYAITITPLDSDGNVSEDASQTTVRVDVSGGQVQIKELTVKVADGSKLTQGEVLNLDFDILAQAFGSRGGAPAARRAASAPAVPAATGSRRRAPAKTERAYRRMPDPDEVRATYMKSRTITGVAAFYDVPTHTAQGWVSRLRRRGIIPATS